MYTYKYACISDHLYIFLFEKFAKLKLIKSKIYDIFFLIYEAVSLDLNTLYVIS